MVNSSFAIPIVQYLGCFLKNRDPFAFLCWVYLLLICTLPPPSRSVCSVSPHRVDICLRCIRLVFMTWETCHDSHLTFYLPVHALEQLKISSLSYVSKNSQLAWTWCVMFCRFRHHHHHHRFLPSVDDLIRSDQEIDNIMVLPWLTRCAKDSIDLVHFDGWWWWKDMNASVQKEKDTERDSISLFGNKWRFRILMNIP